MHFFEKQRIDAAGYLGVSLQKSLIFLMIVSLLGGLGSGSFLSALLGVGFLFIAFWGAYKRRTCLLAIYFWVNVTCFIVGIIGALVLIMMVPMYSNDNYSSGSTEASGSMSIDSSNTGVQHIQKLVSSFVTFPTLSPHNATHITPSNSSLHSDPQIPTNPSTPISSDSWDHGSVAPERENVNVGAVVVVSFVAVVLIVLVIFFKVYSVILAWKMRKLLIANRRCASSAPVSSPVCEDTKPLINPGYPAAPVNNDVSMSVFPEQAQQQAPMFMPSPYAFNPMQMHQMQQFQLMQQMQGQQFPMVFNQNGQPVFYSYQPVPQQGAQL